MFPLIIKGFLFVTVASTAINFVYLNVVDVDLKQSPILENKLLDLALISNESEDLNAEKEQDPNTTNEKENLPKEQPQTQQEETKKEIKEKLRTQLEESIFSLQKNLLNLIIQKQTSNQEIIDEKKFFNTNKILNNENNQLEKEEEILKSLKNNIKTLYESKKNLRKKNSEYLDNVYNFFFSFSVNQEWENFFRIGKDQDSTGITNYRKINLTKKTFSSADKTETTFGILFKDSENTNSKTLLDIGSENFSAKEWNEFSQLNPNDPKINDFTFTKEEFKLLNSHWGTPLCETSSRTSRMIGSNTMLKNFLYSCLKENEINIKKRLDIVIEEFDNLTSMFKFEKLKKIINISWDDLKKEKKNFADEVKKIQKDHLTYNLTEKEMLEFLPFENTEEIKEKNTENLIKKLSEKWSEESFLKVMNP